VCVYVCVDYSIKDKSQSNRLTEFHSQRASTVYMCMCVCLCVRGGGYLEDDEPPLIAVFVFTDGCPVFQLIDFLCVCMLIDYSSESQITANRVTEFHIQLCVCVCVCARAPSLRTVLQCVYVCHSIITVLKDEYITCVCVCVIC
jgi:hypothetical protein